MLHFFDKSCQLLYSMVLSTNSDKVYLSFEHSDIQDATRPQASNASQANCCKTKKTIKTERKS